MNYKNYIYENDEFNEVIKKIKCKKLSKKDLKKYIINGNVSENEINKIYEKIISLNNNVIKKKEEIKNTKKELSEFLDKDFANYIVDYLIGYGKISKIIFNDDVEEIMINNYNSFFIISRKDGKKKIDISFTSKEIDDFVDMLKNTVKKYFKKRKFIDGILPDGSRLNIVSKDIADFNVITIRKYTKDPLTIVDLINNKTITPEVAAYLWTVVDGFKVRPANIFICGGTSTGKTTFLSVLLNFIDPNERIILVEDTKEVDISFFDNSVSLISEISDSNSLADITVNTLRMRPDRIIIGEVRGKEAQSLFTAMDTGHEGCMATLHANNSNDVITKLISKPMEIPEVNINLLDLIIILKRGVINKKIIRYISQITEIQRMGNINLNDIYNLKTVSDIDNEEINVMSSLVIERLSKLLDISKMEIKTIIDYRAELLKNIVSSGRKYSSKELMNIFQDPKIDYKEILKRIR